jgi:hypothetical protein
MFSAWLLELPPRRLWCERGVIMTGHLGSRVAAGAVRATAAAAVGGASAPPCTAVLHGQNMGKVAAAGGWSVRC